MAIAQTTLAKLAEELKATRVTRGIQEVVLHHTWSPTAAQYRGRATWEGIDHNHRYVRGWDGGIGYHVGIARDGSIWLLRPITRSGAHVLNRNRHTVGVVLVGNFDVEDPMENGLSVAAQVVRVLVDRFKLKPEHIRFHREFQNKTCPGTKIDLGDFRRMVMGANANETAALKVVVLPENKIVECRPEVDGGKVRCDLRPLAEELGAKVADHIRDQGKVYVRRGP
jgi:hypothetical protein